MEDNKFLFASFFYNKEDWHFLIRNFLKPLTDEIKQYNHNLGAIVHLSYDRGENIGFTIPVPANDAMQIASLIDATARDFFSLYGSSQKKVESYNGKFFKDFPVNSVQYNLHFFPFTSQINERDESNLRPFYFISELIMGMMANDAFDDESIFTFSFYLHMLLIKSLSGNMMSADLIEEQTQSLQADYQSSFEENMPVLFEITESILDNAMPPEEENLWMDDWKNLCANLFSHDNNMVSSDNKPLLFYKKISFGIRKQLGFNSVTDNMLASFIRYCIAKREGMRLV
ncbi:MAG: hypothetical protein JST75_17250 [Bacteroidetes bacterium]|nr:hypothetical protein [Bacteroidota bacterium]